MDMMNCVERLAMAVGVKLSTPTMHDWSAIERSIGGLALPSDYKNSSGLFVRVRWVDPSRTI